MIMATCSHFDYRKWATCGAPATRMREVGDYQRPYCKEHDPVRIEQTGMNRAERLAEKKRRWNSK